MMAYTSARYDDSPMTAPTPIGRIIVAGPRLFFFAVRLKGSEDRLVVVVDPWSAPCLWAFRWHWLTVFASRPINQGKTTPTRLSSG